MTSTTAIWTEVVGTGPIVAVAVHDGHELRSEVAEAACLRKDEQLREEDPGTGAWAEIAPTRLVAVRSRFEVDLNRPRDTAVYRTPEDAWGLEVWSSPLADDVVKRSLVGYDAFYARLETLLKGLVEKYGRFVLLDLHSYNHRRGGPDESPDDPTANPQINVGTGTMNRTKWAPVVDRFIADLRSYDFPGGPLDVRENVRFRGGNVVKWVHETFPNTGCGLAVEVKKFYMDEWTGEAIPTIAASVKHALAAALPALERAFSAPAPRASGSRSATKGRRPTLSRPMRLGLVCNDVATEEAGYTTARLAVAAQRRGHEVYYISVGDLAYDADEQIRAKAYTTLNKKHKNTVAYLKELRGKSAVQERITVDDLDVLMLRNDPAPDALARPWATQAGIIFGRVAMRHGVIVLNDPDGLAKATNKMYFQTFPEEVRPRTIITRNRDEIRAFANDANAPVVLKPLQGSGGQSVFLCRPSDLPNMNQMIDAVSRDGFVIAQEYLPAAEEGDTRLFVMNGEPLRYKGRYAAFRRVRRGGDMRSNLHAGGGLARAELSDDALRLVEIVRPKLVQDGMFLVGLDIVGDKLMEINVFSPGGLGSAQKFEGVNFSDAVMTALERKVQFMSFYRRDFDNVGMATL